MNTPRQILTSTHQEWNTPPAVFAWLNSGFHFTVDAAADFHNALCEKFFDEKMNGLAQNWDNEIVFCNPPYGRKQVEWITKAAESKGTSALLIPARTDTAVWQKIIFPRASAIVFMRGRLTFTLGEKAKNPATFASAVVVFGCVSDDFVKSAQGRGFVFSNQGRA